jgi:hypothetical protein
VAYNLPREESRAARPSWRDLATWDYGVYACTWVRSASWRDAKLETKKANDCDLNPNNGDGLDSKWQHLGKKDAELETKKGNSYLSPRLQQTEWLGLQVLVARFKHDSR